MNVATFDPYNHGRGQDHNNIRGRNFGRGRVINHGRGHGYKENFKEKLHQQKWNKNTKRKKKGVKIMAKRLKIYVIVMAVNVIGPVPLIHQSIL